MESAQRVRPLIVVVDDAQWLDEPSLDALSYALRRLHSGRVLLVFSLRHRPCPGRADARGRGPGCGTW